MKGLLKRWYLRGLREYKILSEIAEGGMSVIYKARSRLTGEMVAVKLLHAKYASKRIMIENMFAEEQVEGAITSSLAHPSIVKTYSYGNTGSYYYFIMEYINGPNLNFAIYKQPGMVRERKMDIIVKIAEGLDYLHSKGIIHRDICPKNILLTREGDVKIIDFGLAIVKGAKYIARGERAGTPSYMAPEQVRAFETDERTDIYSFGVTIYELIAEAPPFSGQDAYSRMQNHLNIPAAPLSQRAPGISRELEKIVAKAMRKEPSERYGSVREMLCDFRGVPEPKGSEDKKT